MEAIFESDFNRLLDSIRKQYEFEKSCADEATRKLKEFNRDEEIQMLQESIAHLRKNSLLMLSDSERDKISKFRRDHYERHKYTHLMSSGSTFMYTLTGTGVGNIIEITCPICNETEDVTDLSSW